MVAVALAVGGDVDELRLAAVCRSAEAAEQALGEVFAAVQQAFEGDGAGDGAVVEEQAMVRPRRAGRGRGAWDRRCRSGVSFQGVLGPEPFDLAEGLRAGAARGRTGGGRGW